MSSEAYEYEWTNDGILQCCVGTRDDNWRNVLVQRVPKHLLEGREDDNFDWCNTCNHNTPFKLSFFESAPRDDDDSITTSQRIQIWEEAAAKWRSWYNTRLSQTKMDNWYPVLGNLCGERRRHGLVFSIKSEHQQKYFQPSSFTAQQGQCAKLLFEDEAHDLAILLLEENPQLRSPSPPSGWFVRTSDCSPKDAMQDGGAGPHHKLEAVILALFASDQIHKTLRNHKYARQQWQVYLTEFDHDVNIERELRVFVHENQVRAISQYHVCGTSELFSAMSPAELARVANQVNDFHCRHVKPRWTINSSYTMDVEYIHQQQGSSEIRLIELNSFGKEMAAASSLFHWERDERLLYGRTKTSTGNDTDSDARADSANDTSSSICIRVRE